METYKEYPIRCKTCNEQIACFAEEYENLVDSGLTIEETLNTMDIMHPCSRQAFMNPVTVNFNMENREVIEGFKTVDTVTDEDIQKESTSRPVFTACLGDPLVTKAPLIIGVKTVPTVQTRVQAAAVVPTTRLQIGAGLQTIQRAQPTVQTTQKDTPKTNIFNIGQIVPVDVIAPIISRMELGLEMQPVGEGIPINFNFDVGEFVEPTIVGVPTINNNPLIPLEKQYVGAGKYSQILNGRTYLAQ